MPDPDWNDPCAVLNWLRPKYYAAAAGSAVVSVKYGDNEVQYSSRNNNLSQLETLMKRLEADCAAKCGKSRRRSFIAG
jgi:hypothetical protein